MTYRGCTFLLKREQGRRGGPLHALFHEITLLTKRQTTISTGLTLSSAVACFKLLAVLGLDDLSYRRSPIVLD